MNRTMRVLLAMGVGCLAISTTSAHGDEPSCGKTTPGEGDQLLAPAGPDNTAAYASQPGAEPYVLVDGDTGYIQVTTSDGIEAKYVLLDGSVFGCFRATE